MNLEPEKRKEIAERAVRYLRDGEATWVKRYWFVDVDALETNDAIFADKQGPHAIGSSASLGCMRQWLRDHNFGARNRRCGVCAEGALLLAMAEDTSIPDNVSGVALLSDFSRDAEQAACALGLVDELHGWESLMTYNDDRAEEADDVVRLLESF